MLQIIHPNWPLVHLTLCVVKTLVIVFPFAYILRKSNKLLCSNNRGKKRDHDNHKKGNGKAKVVYTVNQTENRVKYSILQVQQTDQQNKVQEYMKEE